MDCDQGQLQRSNWRSGCVITTGGVCQNAKKNGQKNGQIGESDIVRDDWNAGSTAQPACGFRGTPPYAIVHAIPEFIWGMSGNMSTRTLEVIHEQDEARGTRPR